MVLGSDKISGVNKPLVQLKLLTGSAFDSSESISENVIEMDLAELNVLLKNLKQAQAVSLLFVPSYFNCIVSNQSKCMFVFIERRHK